MALAVASPMAAIFALPKTRASLPEASRRHLACGYAVGAGEDDPVVIAGRRDGVIDRGDIGGGGDFDCGGFDDRAPRIRAFRQFAGLLAGAGDDDCLAEKGAFFEP